MGYQKDKVNADEDSSKEFFSLLKSYYDLKNYSVLDMFARTGDVTVKHYAKDVKSFDLWEYDPKFTHSLLEWEPSNLHIGCSYEGVTLTTNKYDMIVVDTPQGSHEDYMEQIHYEHFDILDKAKPLMNSRCLVVLYCNKRPYDRAKVGHYGYDEYKSYDFQKWMEARKIFYQADPENTTEWQMLRAYTDLFKSSHIVEKVVLTPCHSDVPGIDPYGFRLALELIEI